ncbi:MAG: methyltransferase domain-containing protein, partial [Candidatus Helarchaeota archaeon]
EKIRQLYKKGVLKRFCPAQTARSRNNASLPLRIAFSKGKVHLKSKLVLDFGKGRSIDCEFVSQQGGVCYIYDIDHFPLIHTAKTYDHAQRIRRITPNSPKERFDVIICTYVLNVVTQIERQLLAETLCKLIKPTGVIILGIREDLESAKQTWKQFEDGYITPKNTFQSFFPLRKKGLERLVQLFSRMRLIRIGRGTWIIRHSKTPQRLKLIKTKNCVQQQILV